MTEHLKDGNKRDKMVTFLVTKPFYDRMKVTSKTHKENISALSRRAIEKEIRRMNNE